MGFHTECIKSRYFQINYICKSKAHNVIMKKLLFCLNVVEFRFIGLEILVIRIIIVLKVVS